MSQQSFVYGMFDPIQTESERMNRDQTMLYRPRDQSVVQKVVWYENQTRYILDKIAEGSSRKNWARFSDFYGIIHKNAEKMRRKVTNMRKHVTRAILKAYIGSEK